MEKRVSVLQDCRNEICGKEPVPYISLVFHLRHVRKWEKLSSKRLKKALQALGYVFRSVSHTLGTVEYVSDCDFSAVLDRRSGRVINAF